ncbi:uncharacterized protein LOC110859119 isoform X1 [Folsomia candida]|uniref:uncharacterized protein LOC110859119 isoform X1 n=1 Tax=Folsomia candida TaxID=158441 RepID=UPI001604A462|nr:uncharacterized protein LOC110859119 isoform X1 [Folsomia candida]
MKLVKFPVSPLKFFLIFLLIGPTLCLSESFGCPGFESAEEIGRTPPILTLSKLPRLEMQEFRNNDVVINATKITPINLDCWAAYPIDLTFSGHLTNQKAEIRTKVTGYTGSNGVSSHCYHINVTLTTYQEISGNYSCFQVENPTLVTSKFIFVQTPPRNIMLRSGESIRIVVNPAQKTVTLPCAISNRNMAKDIQLWKIDGNSQLWLRQSSMVKYDPKVGFVMSLGTEPVDSTFLGSYQCGRDFRDKVKVELVGPPDWTVYPKTRRIIRLKKGDIFRVECLSKNETVFLRSVPELRSELPNSEEEKAALFHNRDLVSFYKSAEILYTTSFQGNDGGVGRVECVRKVDNATLFQWQYQVSNETAKSGVLDTRRFLNSCPTFTRPTNNGTPSTMQSEELDIVLFECDNWIACRMSKCLRNYVQDSTCVSNNHCVKTLCMPNGIIQCPSVMGVHAEIFFTGFNGVKYTNWKSAETKDILRIVPIMPQKSSRHPSVTLKCEGTSFVVSGGFKWFLKFENGTILDSRAFSSETTTLETWGDTKSILRNSLTFSPDFSPASLESFICSAPVWNSTDWINATVQMRDEIGPLVRKAMRENTPRNSSVTCLVPVWIWILCSFNSFL